MLPKQPKGRNRFRDGVVGMDALWNGFCSTSMRCVSLFNDGPLNAKHLVRSQPSA